MNLTGCEDVTRPGVKCFQFFILASGPTRKRHLVNEQVDGKAFINVELIQLQPPVVD